MYRNPVCGYWPSMAVTWAAVGVTSGGTLTTTGGSLAIWPLSTSACSSTVWPMSCSTDEFTLNATACTITASPADGATMNAACEVAESPPFCHAVTPAASSASTSTVSQPRPNFTEFRAAGMGLRVSATCHVPISAIARFDRMRVPLNTPPFRYIWASAAMSVGVE